MGLLPLYARVRLTKQKILPIVIIESKTIYDIVKRVFRASSSLYLSDALPALGTHHSVPKPYLTEWCGVRRKRTRARKSLCFK
jgi:hypothetical protein